MMGPLRSLSLSLTLFACFLFSSSFASNTFYVGGKDGWVLYPSEPYNHWAERLRFLIGDTLIFKYNNGSDSVLQVHKEDYYNCHTKTPIKSMTSGTSIFKFDHSGPFFFISGNKHHCGKGQKLIVVVLSPRSPIPHPPSSQPSSKPPSSQVIPISPSPISLPPKVSPIPSKAPTHSPSKSPYLSPSTSPTPSQSPHISPFISPIPSKAPHISPSPSLTPSKAPSPSPTQSKAPYISPSTSPGPSKAPYISPSSSHTPYISPSPTSISPAPSPAATPEKPSKEAPAPVHEGGSPANITAPAPAPSASNIMSPSSVLLLSLVTLLVSVVF